MQQKSEIYDEDIALSEQDFVLIYSAGVTQPMQTHGEEYFLKKKKAFPLSLLPLDSIFCEPFYKQRNGIDI